MEPFIGEIILFGGSFSPRAAEPRVSEIVFTKIADNSATGL